LTSLCDGHHKALHQGKLKLAGRAPNITLRFANDPAIPHVETHVSARHAEATSTPHVESHVTARHLETTSTSSAYATAVMRAEAKQALQKLGFKPPISSKCVDAALASRPPPATLEQLIRAALQQSR
ncbi:MAG TPA: RuvA C-terminal domain-containing protein, partial [Kofleriaceae bacterium]